MKEQEFVMLVGLPGAGKTYYAKRLEKEGYIICSSDEMRKELYGDEAEQSNASHVFNCLNKKVIGNIEEGKSVVYDATGLNMKTRAPIMKQLQPYKLRKVARVIARPFEDCVRLNNARSRVVPMPAMEKMYRSFTMPFLFEGFTDIEVVYPNPSDKTSGGHYADVYKRYVYTPHDHPLHPETIGQHMLNVCNKIKELTNDEVLIQTALVHDIGKEHARGINPKTGNTSFYCHENIGAYDVLFLSGLTDKILTSVYVGYHGRPFAWDVNPKAKEKDFFLMGKIIAGNIQLLNQADRFRSEEDLEKMGNM